MSTIIQTQPIRCPVCNRGTLVFLFDTNLRIEGDPIIVSVRCVSFDTAMLSTCTFPKNERMFELICTLYYKSVRHAKDIQKVVDYTRQLHETYASDVSKMMYTIFQEIKALDEGRSVDTKKEPVT